MKDSYGFSSEETCAYYPANTATSNYSRGDHGYSQSVHIDLIKLMQARCWDTTPIKDLCSLSRVSIQVSVIKLNECYHCSEVVLFHLVSYPFEDNYWNNCFKPFFNPKSVPVQRRKHCDGALLG